MQVDPIRNSTMPARGRCSQEIAVNGSVGNDRHFLHGKQKRAPTNFTWRSITGHGATLLSRGSFF